MKALALLSLVLRLVLGLGCVFVAARMLDRAGRVELGRVKVTTLAPDLAAKLANLKDDLFVTWYATAPSRMPTHLRNVEHEVRALLDALVAAGKGRVRYHIVDPTDEEDLKRFAARRKVAPVRVRSVAHDQFSEQEVWSTLTIAYGPGTPAMISGITEDHLPRLQTILLEQLRQIEDPRPPVFALCAPQAGFGKVRAWLAERGKRIDCDLEHDLPSEADVLIVLDPRDADASALRRVRHFLDRGGSAIVAGDLYRKDLVDKDGAPNLVLEQNGEGFATLLTEFGVHPVPGVLLDQKSASLTLATGETPAPFRVTVLTLNQDFQPLAKDPRGTLFFVVPTPLELDAPRLTATGYAPTVLATSSDQCTVLPFEGKASFPLATLAQGGGVAVAKQPLLVWLRPVDSWKGSLVVAGSSGLANDDVFDVPTIANQRCLDALLATIAAPDRLALGRSGIIRPPPLPEMSGGSRLFWRLACVFLIPIALLVFALVRRRRDAGAPAAASVSRGRRGALALRVAAGLACVALVAAGARATRVEVDLTKHGLNRIAPESRAIASAAGGAVAAELIFSGDERLPPEVKPELARLQDALAEFGRAGAGIDVKRVRPEEMSEPERKALEDAGIEPATATSAVDEVTTVRSYFAALRLKLGDRVETLGFTGRHAFESLEFRLAFALWRLETGKHPKVGFASDVPRLTSAEAYQFFQTKGLIPPSGKDVYSLARAALEGLDFDVEHVNPREPKLPSDLDALVWIQPRRSIEPMLARVVDYLYRGGHVLLAAQQFAIQARQYRGRNLDYVYWPAPQSPDVDDFYFPALGIQLLREVLFDAQSFRVELDTQLHRSGRREFERQNLAKPFLVRALASNFAKDERVMQGLGDMPWLYGNQFVLDDAKIADHRLRVKPLMFTSEKSWSFAWKAAWIPPGMMAGPGATPHDAEDKVPSGTQGRVPLALRVDGQFPWPTQAFEHPAREYTADGKPVSEPVVPPYPEPEPKADARPGRLLFFGETEMWKDEWLVQLEPQFRADQLLQNAAAVLALPDELAAILVRRDVTPGFERVEPARAASMRAAVIFGFPSLMLVLLIGSAIARLVSRPSVRRSAR